MLLSSEVFISPGIEVNNFAEQPECVVTIALDNICPAITRHVCFSRRCRSPLLVKATMQSVGVRNVAGYDRVM